MACYFCAHFLFDMDALFSLDGLISLITLSLLEVVLGIDNVIFVSILMGRLKPEKRKRARTLWMILGISVRSALLLSLGWLLTNGNRELFGLNLGDTHYGFNLRNVIMFAGGLFLLYKTVKEIHHKLEGDDIAASGGAAKTDTFAAVMAQIVIIDMVFSFDSIITAIGMAKHVEIMIIAVIIAMIIMFFFADSIAKFIEKHPTLKMLALSFLLMVGFSLFFEGLEPIHGSHINKTYIYVAMAFSFGVELLNMRMRRKEAQKAAVHLRGPKLEEAKEEFTDD
jgi:predicted tellurium resistance membrane protein TerC